MLKFYIVSSCVVTALTFIAEFKKYNKNIKTYIDKHSEKKSLAKEIKSWIKCIIYSWIPIFNIFYGCGLLYILFASDYTVIKLLEDQKRKEDRQKREIEKILNRE